MSDSGRNGWFEIRLDGLSLLPDLCQAEIVLKKRRMRRPAANVPGHAHELTFSTYHRYPFLQAERVCEWLAETHA